MLIELTDCPILTGEPLYNSIVWLDNRTSDIVESLIDRISGRDINYLKDKTGLPISTYFSALKIKWLIENLPEVKKTLDDGLLMFGTVDSWLLWNLTKKHMTDVTNASRTLLMDLETLQWDQFLCDFFKIPMNILPEIKSSSSWFGEIQNGPLTSIPITGIIGDQSASLVGQKCLNIGQVKVTYGTGAFLMQNIGPGPLQAAHRNISKEAKRKLLTTVAYKLDDQLACYALEGSIAIAGAAITWLRDSLQIINNYGEVEDLAQSDSSSGGMYFVPAFQGLYAPYWDAYASGLIIGISQFSRKCHLVRATLDGVAFQTNDILSLMNSGFHHGIRVDGGMSSNDLLCQILADVTGNVILRSKMAESSAFGAALVASHYCGLWDQLLRGKQELETVETNRDLKINGFFRNDYQENNLDTKFENFDRDQTIHSANKFSIIKTITSTINYLKTLAKIASKSKTDQISSSLSSYQASISSTSSSSDFFNDEHTLNEYDLFRPEWSNDIRTKRVSDWQAAVRRCRKWVHVEQKEQKQIQYLRLSLLPISLYALCSLGLCIISKKT